MINVYNLTEQTVEPGEALILDGTNFGRCNCNNTNLIFRPGVYRLAVSENSAPTVAGQIIWNLTADGVVIPGGEIQTPGTTVEINENGSAEVIIPVSGNTSIRLVNNSENADVVPARNASLIIRREA